MKKMKVGDVEIFEFMDVDKQRKIIKQIMDINAAIVRQNEMFMQAAVLIPMTITEQMKKPDL